MNWGLRASVLIALQSQRGAFCSPAWLAKNVIGNVEAIAQLCSEMNSNGEIDMGAVPGAGFFYGVGVVDEHPRFIDVADPPAEAPA